MIRILNLAYVYDRDFVKRIKTHSDNLYILHLKRNLFSIVEWETSLVYIQKKNWNSNKISTIYVLNNKLIF